MEELIRNIRSLHPGLVIRKSKCRVSSEIVHVQISDPELQLMGTGTGFGNNEALIKAYSEYVERATMRFHMKQDSSIMNSSGFASHINRDSSIASAHAELIERDAFLTLWHSGNSPYWLSCQNLVEVGLPTWFYELIPQVSSNGISLRLGIVAKTGNFVTAIAALVSSEEERKFGCIFDTAAGSSLQEALAKVTLGITPCATVLWNRKDAGKIFKKIAHNEVDSIFDHMEYYLDPENFPTWFFEKSESIANLKEPNVEIVECAAVPNVINAKVFRAQSSEVQSFYIGYRMMSINLDRIRDNFKIGSDNHFIEQVHPLI